MRIRFHRELRGTLQASDQIAQVATRQTRGRTDGQVEITVRRSPRARDPNKSAYPILGSCRRVSRMGVEHSGECNPASMRRERRPRSTMPSYFAGGVSTPSTMCTMPLEARIEATTLASFTITLPSLTWMVTLTPLAIARRWPSVKLGASYTEVVT